MKKMQNAWLLGVMLLAMFSCGDPEQRQVLPPPADLIPKERMVELMIEMQILEAKVVEGTKTKRDSAIHIFNDAQHKLLAKLGTDSAQYYSSEAFYMQDLKMYAEMVTIMADSIDLMRNRLSD